MGWLYTQGQTEQAALFAEAESSAANGPRHYWRCPCCLSLIVCDQSEEQAREYNIETGLYRVTLRCGIDDSRLEYMGRVVRQRIQRIDHFACPCDHRCTGARGPDCDCQCGGANHGTGLMVPVYVSQGIPRVRPRDETDAMKRAAAYREARDAARIRISWAFAIMEQKRKYGWIENTSDWSRAQSAIQAYSKANWMRQHIQRLKALEKVGR